MKTLNVLILILMTTIASLTVFQTRADPTGNEPEEAEPPPSHVPSNPARHFSRAIYATDYGVVADYMGRTKPGTDNTAALQNAIDAAQEQAGKYFSGVRLILPPGAMLTGPLKITKPIYIEGSHSQTSTLVEAPGNNVPLLTVKVTGTNYPHAGNPADVVFLENFRLMSVDGPAANDIEPKADGLYIPAQTVQTFIYGQNITITSMPGNGVHCDNMANSGLGIFDNLIIASNGGSGLFLLGPQIWTFNSPQIAANRHYGVLANEAMATTFNNLDLWSNKLDGIYITGTNDNITFTGATQIQDNKLAGIHLVNVGTSGRNSGTTGIITFGPGLTINKNSTASANTHPAFLFDGANDRAILYLNGDALAYTYGHTPPGTATSEVANENYTFQFINGSQSQVFCTGCAFGNGGVSSPGVTNAPGQVNSIGVPRSDWWAGSSPPNGWEIQGAIDAQSGLKTTTLNVTPSTPASSSTPCVTGQISTDSNYIYVCTATNSWKRSALGSF